MKPSNRMILALASMILLAVLLSGCGLPWPFPQPTPDPKLPDAQQILRPLASGANAGEIDTFDPGQIQFGFDYDKAQMIYPMLITLTDDLKPIDWAAKSHEVSADGLTYTFHLNSGMKWSDGTAIDANTFAYSINRSLDPCFASGVSYYNLNIKGATAYNSKTCDLDSTTGLDKTAATGLIGKSIVASDPLTLAVTIEAPAAYFLSEMSYPTCWGVPKQLIDKYGQTKWTDHMADGSGLGGNLYKLTKWDKAGHLEFTANDSFWGKKPIIQHVNYTLYKDVAVEWSDFTVGKGDVSGFPQAQLAAARALKGVSVQQIPGLDSVFVTPNAHLAPFDDVRMRQAFTLALDRNALVLRALSSSQANLPPETMRAYRLPTIHLVPEGVPGYNPDLADGAGRTGTDALTSDRDAARKLASAYAAEHCGGEYRTCPPIAFLRFEHTSPTFTTLMQALMDQWQQAFPGWVMQFAWVPGVERPIIPPYQLTVDVWPVDYPDPQDFLSQRWSSIAPDYSFTGHVNVTVPQVDAWLSQADGMADSTARLELYQQAEELLINQAATFPLWQYLQTYAVRSRVVKWGIAPTNVTPLSMWQSAYITR